MCGFASRRNNTVNPVAARLRRRVAGDASLSESSPRSRRVYGILADWMNGVPTGTVVAALVWRKFANASVVPPGNVGENEIWRIRTTGRRSYVYIGCSNVGVDDVVSGRWSLGRGTRDGLRTGRCSALVGAGSALEIRRRVWD